MATRTLEIEILTTAAGRRSLAGFVVSGILLSFLGAMLPVWGYHLESKLSRVGWYFLALNAGLLLALRLSRWLLNRLSIQTVLILSCLAAVAGFLVLAFFPPPFLLSGRIGGLLLVGAAAGLMNTTVLHAITPIYRQEPASTLNVAGMLFGAGCLLTSLVAAGTFYCYSPALVSAAFAILPLTLAFYFQRSPFPRTPAVANLRVEERRPFDEVIEDFRSPSALLFALLLFVQFGNEWSLAGWLPLLLMQGLGASPGVALMVLAEYWFCLMIGRGVAQALLPRFSHGRLLMFSILAAAVGCLILATTNNLFGATMAVLFTGGGFAMIYPLVAEQIGDRFPYYHPGFFNGIFSLAVTGAMLAPGALGYLTEWLGIRAVLAVPFVGTLAVFVILGLIWIESKLNRSR